MFFKKEEKELPLSGILWRQLNCKFLPMLYYDSLADLLLGLFSVTLFTRFTPVTHLHRHISKLVEEDVCIIIANLSTVLQN